MARFPLLAFLFQEGTGMKTTGEETTGEETTGLAEGAAKAAGRTTEETFNVLSTIQSFFAGALDYVTSTEFIGNLLASAVVVVLGLIAYRLLTRGVPRVIRWRTHRRDDVLDSETVARLKR